MNEMKTEVLYQSSNGQLEPQIHVGGVVLKNGKKLQYLGGIVQNDAKMDNDLQNRICKASHMWLICVWKLSIITSRFQCTKRYC